MRRITHRQNRKIHKKKKSTKTTFKKKSSRTKKKATFRKSSRKRKTNKMKGGGFFYIDKDGKEHYTDMFFTTREEYKKLNDEQKYKLRLFMEYYVKQTPSYLHDSTKETIINKTTDLFRQFDHCLNNECIKLNINAPLKTIKHYKGKEKQMHVWNGIHNFDHVIDEITTNNIIDISKHILDDMKKAYETFKLNENKKQEQDGINKSEMSI